MFTAVKLKLVIAHSQHSLAYKKVVAILTNKCMHPGSCFNSLVRRIIGTENTTSILSRLRLRRCDVLHTKEWIVYSALGQLLAN